MQHSNVPRRRQQWRLALLTTALSTAFSCVAEDGAEDGAEDLTGGAAAPRSGSTIIDHGDGTYEYALPPEANIEPHWAGPFMVEYDGQTVYTWDEEPWPEALLIHDEVDQRTHAEMARDLVIEDANHSRWRVVDHDDGEWDELVNLYNEEMDLTYGPEQVEQEIEEDEFSGVTEVHPYTWTETCGGGRDQAVWDAESRSPFFSPPSVRMAKTVVLFRDTSTGNQAPFTNQARCSGFMVDDNVMMTAQHCVVDAAGVPHDLRDFVACTQGNEDVGARCSTIRSRARPVPFRVVDDTDWAMLGLRNNLGAGNFMPLSRASAGVVEAQPAFNAGYPAHLNNLCNNNPVGLTGGTVAAFPHRAGFWSSANGTDLRRTMTNTHLDGAVGQSGSPIYYYPGGCCGAHFATGVLAGYRPQRANNLEDGWVTGPRISRIRTLLISLFPIL